MGSSASSAAAKIMFANLSSAVNKPVVSWPRAMMMAPVKVAISMTKRGLKRSAYVNASARTRRPSASVFVISTVFPL